MTVVHRPKLLLLLLQPRTLGRKLPVLGCCSAAAAVLTTTTTSTVPTAIRRRNRTTATVESGVARLSVRLPLAVGKIPVATRATAAAWPALPGPVVVVGVVWILSVLPPPDRRRRRGGRCGHCYDSVCVLVRNRSERMAKTRKRTVVERKRLSSAGDFGFLGRYYWYYWRVNRT